MMTSTNPALSKVAVEASQVSNTINKTNKSSIFEKRTKSGSNMLYTNYQPILSGKYLRMSQKMFDDM